MALLALGAAGAAHAQISALGYLDITVDLVGQERHPHDDGSDLLVMTMEVTNHESRTLDGYGVSTELVALDGRDILYYPRTHWADGQMAESCPGEVPSIPARLTKVWNTCFEVPAGLEPDLLVITGGFGAGHAIQFDARQATSCLDLFHDTVCVPYALNGPPDGANAPGPISDGFGVFDALDGAKGIATATISGRSYAVVASSGDDAVQIIDITDPARPIPASSVFDGVGGFDALDGAGDVVVVGMERVYAIVASHEDSGIQIIEITDPRRPVPTSSAIASVGEFAALGGVSSISISPFVPHILVTDNAGGVHGISDSLSKPKLAYSVFDGVGGFDALAGAHDIATVSMYGSTYAVVASWEDDGVQVMHVDSGSNRLVPVSSVFDGERGFDALDGAEGVTAAEISGRWYALVASWSDDAVQMIDITDPHWPAPIWSVFDGERGFDALAGPGCITTAEISGRTYALVASWSDDGVQIIDITDPKRPVPSSSVFDGDVVELHAGDGTSARAAGDGDDLSGGLDAPNSEQTTYGVFDALAAPSGITTASISDRTYVLVASRLDDAVQIINITDQFQFIPVRSILDGAGGFDALAAPSGITTVDISGRAYALVASSGNHGIQIIDIADPSQPTPASSVFDGEDGFDALSWPSGITTVDISERAYALVMSLGKNGIQIIDITDPSQPTPASSVFDGEDGFDALSWPSGITTVDISGRAYALVASWHDDAVQIINITVPEKPVPVLGIVDGVGGFDALDGPTDVTTASILGRTYALVASSGDHGIQIIDITDPTQPTPTSSAFDGEDGFDALAGAEDITTVNISGRTYALVASWSDSSVTIIDITYPPKPEPAVYASDHGYGTLAGAEDITTVEISGRTYAIIASSLDNGVQIIDITSPDGLGLAFGIWDGYRVALNGE